MIVRVFFFQVAEDIIKNGFMYNGEKYVLFSASAGQIRTKKFVVIREKDLNLCQNKLMCGLNWDRINERGGINANKYLAYYALLNSATETWEEFDIDRAIVVEDFETMINAQVDYIDDVSYEIKRTLMDVLIPHTDGCGMKLHGRNVMIRLPWFKGLMGVFPFDELVLQWREKFQNNNIGVIEDIYGKKYDIIADNIEFIFTKSQFKMWKYYDSWEEYKSNFKKYQCEPCMCNEEEENIGDAKINYQMLQTLWDMSQTELKRIAKKTVNNINNLGNDFRTMMRVLGVTKYNSHKTYLQKSIEIYPELMRDAYNKQILRDCKRSLVKEGRAGRLSIEGKYTFVLPDLYAFCEWLFLKESCPQGLLQNDEVCCHLYQNGRELDCLRSPHLYKEHVVRRNKVNQDTNKWFKTNAIYTSTKDVISKYLMFDCDGDKLLVVADKTICKVAKRNMENIVPLYYDMKKAENIPISKEALFDGLVHAYVGGNIGIYSNNISKIHNYGKHNDECFDVIKLLCMENNFVIDYAKTLYKPIRPKDKDEMIKRYTQMLLPHFFIYAKDKEKRQVEDINNSTVNRLYDIIPNPILRINKSIGKIDIGMLLSDQSFHYPSNYEKIVDLYDYWNRKKKYILKNKKRNKEYDNESYVYQKIRRELLSLDFSKNDIINTLIKFLFENRESSDKKILWECFGKEIYHNIKTNLDKMDIGQICPICGRRFYPTKNQKCCSIDCSKRNKIGKIYGKRY